MEVVEATGEEDFSPRFSSTVKPYGSQWSDEVEVVVGDFQIVELTINGETDTAWEYAMVEFTDTKTLDRLIQSLLQARWLAFGGYGDMLDKLQAVLNRLEPILPGSPYVWDEAIAQLEKLADLQKAGVK